MPSHHHDLVVVGTGTAANVVAGSCRQSGWSVAVIDHRPFGGTCALRGCDPKKVLRSAVEIADGFRRMQDIGTIKGDLTLDWMAMQRHKHSFTDPVPEAREASYADQGIDAFHGHARFIDAHALQVGDDRLQGKHVVIAAGAKPVDLPIDGAHHLVTSDAFMELDTLPQRVVLVGGGYIGFEFAHLAARAGAHVTMLHRDDTPLGAFDPDLVRLLVKRTRAIGVDVRLGHEVKAVRRTDAGITVEADAAGEHAAFDADLAVHCAGRVPALGELDLDAAGIEHHHGRLELDRQFRSTSQPHVYAAGDAAGGPLPLTPVAALEAHAVVDNLLRDAGSTVDYTGIPSVVFTLPALARVGLRESQAREQGLRYRVKHETVPNWFTARRVNEQGYAYKVLVEEESKRLLGAHMIGPDASETINVFAFAMRSGLNADALRHATFAYPTAASDIASMLP